jgi:uncharacterized protein YqcC (DUF446 family)
MADVYREIEQCLDAIEMELRRLDYWQKIPPSATDLASVLPFCCDTLEFPQWLQFIFIVKMRALLQSGAPLPTVCGIRPYAEEYFKQSGTDSGVLCKHLSAIDKLLTAD